MTYLCLDGWAGRTKYPVEIVGFTPKRVRVRLLEDTRLPGARWHKKGDVVLVPKAALEPPRQAQETSNNGE